MDKTGDWFPERRSKSWLQRMCMAVLKQGPMPQHVAIIMDGNRRFAVKKSMQRCDGHVKGFNKLSETLEWCLDLGVVEVTVYAFSIENFKRSQEEIDFLMELAKQKFQRLMQEKEMIQKHGVCIRVLGNLALLPRDVQEVVAEAVNFSKGNTGAILNVCFAYTARDDMCTAMQELALGVKDGMLQSSDVSEELLESCLYTANSRKVDLLIRTSGEVRLSDFLLWESSYSCLHFTPVLWPEFSVWHLYGAILKYQCSYNTVEAARQRMLSEREQQVRESDYKCVVQGLTETVGQESARQSGEVQPATARLPTPAQVKEFEAARLARQQAFLQRLGNKRAAFLQSMLPRQSLVASS